MVGCFKPNTKSFQKPANSWCTSELGVRGGAENEQLEKVMSKNDPRNRKQSSKKSSSGKKNALVHGVYSCDLILGFESREKFETLLADLREELGPNGRLEEELVFDIAHLRWQKRRLLKIWHVAANSDPFIGNIIRAGKKSWPGIRNICGVRANRFAARPMR
jgi:hypothetical protein